MARPARWKVIEWPLRPTETKHIPLVCPHCGREALLEIGTYPLVVAGTLNRDGFAIITDRPAVMPSPVPDPASLLPAVMQCRGCKATFSATHRKIDGEELLGRLVGA